MSTDFVGRGWSFPLDWDATGQLATVGGVEKVEQSIRLVLATAYGERPMRPEFGCAIHDLVFAPTDTAFAGVVADEVRASLRRWEPRIDVEEVTVTPDDVRPGAVLIGISYRLRATNDRRNLVFPFYSIPEED